MVLVKTQITKKYIQLKQFFQNKNRKPAPGQKTQTTKYSRSIEKWAYFVVQKRSVKLFLKKLQILLTSGKKDAIINSAE